MKLLTTVIATITALGLIGGCTPNITPEHYNTQNTQQANIVKRGVVISASQVDVSGSSSDVGNLAGTVAGGAAGAVLGSTIGGGAGSTLAAIGGAVLGGIAGNKAQDALTSQKATQYIVQLTDGTTVAVTQSGAPLAVGTHVLLLTGNPSRLIVDNTIPAMPAAPATTASLKSAS